MIKYTFRANLSESNGKSCWFPIDAELVYDEGDPLAFTMVFDARGDRCTPWAVGRDLLLEAMTSEALTGLGDVKFQRNSGTGYLETCITSPEGHAHISLPLQPVEAFLDETEEAAAEAVTHLDALLGRALEGILRG